MSDYSLLMDRNFGLVPLQTAMNAFLTSRHREHWVAGNPVVRNLNDRFELQVDLPGVSLSDVQLELEGDQLSLKAARKQPELAGKIEHRERSFAAIEHKWRLPNTANADQITAELALGVLTISIAKKPTTNRTIQVNKNRGEQS